MERTVLIAAGGTGGHLFPAQAFADAMRARGWRIVLMTDERGRVYAKDFVADAIEDVPAATLSWSNPIQAIGAAMKISAGMRAARARLADIKPAVIAGFGGYPSLPALSAAVAQKRPILIHEQNAVLGRVNRHYAPHAQVIACAFERLDRLPPGCETAKVVVGNPVRAPIRAVREAPFPVLSAGGRLPVLVIGGSQGARIFGEVIPPAIARLPQAIRTRLHLTQQVRAEQVDAVKAFYAEQGVQADVAPFFHDMAARLSACCLMIARAGASTVTELAVAGRPAILVPLKIAADDHQTANAEALTSVSAADAIAEDDFTPERLADLLAARLSDPHGLFVRATAARAVGKPDAAERLADLAVKIASRE
jgi:UDP-N-acetylglucosamine--N-acetylmuramyl-(pentapeptide) pyrophosphoryl-undecaprenol N-acetylglucosamine transferase